MPDGICVLDPNSMEVVCQVIMGVNTANLVFGDGGDVFICGAGHVWRLQRKVWRIQKPSLRSFPLLVFIEVNVDGLARALGVVRLQVAGASM